MGVCAYEYINMLIIFIKKDISDKKDINVYIFSI